MIYTKPNSSTDVIYETDVLGLSTVEFRIIDDNAATISDWSGVGVIEMGGGAYRARFTSPAAAGKYYIQFRNNSSDSFFVGQEMHVNFVGAESPGTIGLIADLVRSLIPVTWDKLSSVDYYGTDMLLSRIEVAKYKLFPATIAAQDESVFTVLMREYVAVSATLEIIPAGIEYWAQQRISKSATGTNETVTYGDRVVALGKLAERLQKDLAAMAGNPNLTAFMNPINEADTPDVSGNDDGILITENPYDMNPAFTSQVPGS